MNYDRYAQKLQRFVEFAEKMAEMSTCSRARCGAVVFPADFSEMTSMGYNGPATGRPNGSCTGVEGSCGCVHSEQNAVVKIRAPRGSKLIMYSTTAPCLACAGLIANCGVVRGVLYGMRYRNVEGLTSLAHAGVGYAQLDSIRKPEDLHHLLRDWTS